MKNHIATVLLLSTSISLTALADEHPQPNFEPALSVEAVYTPSMSPDGKHVIFNKRTTDWKENRYDRELWLSKSGSVPFQLTNNAENNSNNPSWSPDGQWIAFLSKMGKKTQIQVVRAAGGAVFQVTNTKQNIGSFEWSPDGSQIAFLQSEDDSDSKDKRKDLYGAFAVEDAEYSRDQLWIIDFKPEHLNAFLTPQQMKDEELTEARKARQLIQDTEFHINDFRWSPDGKKIAIEHQPDPLINTFFKADISIYDIESESLTGLVSNTSYDGLVDWSPNSRSILYTSSVDNTTSNYYTNTRLFRIDLDGSDNKELAQDFDEDLNRITWNKSGIFALGWQKTQRRLLRIDPKSGKTSIVSKKPERIWTYSFSDDAKQIAFAGNNDDDLNEIYVSKYPLKNIKKITKQSKQLDGLPTMQSEVISWNSQDGAEIEGVLFKPHDYDPNKKYPLLVTIHGGPTGISIPGPQRTSIYPVTDWVNKGALVLQPNYRGSAGYGADFRKLNVRNLGVGDAWDVISGVQHLQDKGMIDPEKVGAMGWSQGGYISAFLTTHSDKFAATSVGAGISNWMTYYVNTDIHPFTRQYLKATPWSDPEIYAKTSPMTQINNATTPTLIQHGENDRRVPIANAYELYQGLQDVGADTKFIIYKGFGHGINKPKELLAATWHNWQWFGKYIWGEDIELPMGEEEEEDEETAEEESED